jgi:post-segregation antitoxin (ccd killing protein)
MPKATVYFAEDLFEAARRFDISFSPVCQRAVEEEVRRCQAAAEARADLAAVAARLGRTRVEAEKRDFADGFDLGARWARDHASLAELENLVEMVRAGASIVVLDQDHSLPVFLTGHFWEADPAPDAFTRLGQRAFDRGILAGAVEVYDAVQPYLDTPEAFHDNTPRATLPAGPEVGRGDDS